MNTNQKIALGCGVAGCLGLGLILIIIIVALALGYVGLPGSNRNHNSNLNSNFNSNANTDSNSNTDSDSNLNTNSESDLSSSSSSMSDDDRHKLFQAAGVTRDSALIMRVLTRIGFPSGTGEGYEEFVRAHMAWAMKNLSFIQSVSTPEKARAYVDEHIND